MMKFPRYIGHRGVKIVAPENTMAGFRAAKRLGLTAIEIDVCLTQDLFPIILHDATLDGTTTSTGRIADMRWADLAGVEAIGGREAQETPARIPSFLECLDFCETEKMMLNAELKPHWETGDDLVSAVRPLLEKKKVDVILSSFSLECLHAAHRLLPDIERALLLDEETDNWQEIARSCVCSSIHINQNFSENAVKEIISEGYPVRVYTVNDKKRADTLLSWGVESVITDDPDLLR